MNTRRAGFPSRRSPGLAAIALGFLSACSAPDNGPPPLLRAAAREMRVGEEAYLTGHAAEAIPALTEAARLHLAAGDLPGAVRAFLNLALAQRSAGDNAAAASTAGRLRDITAAAQQQALERKSDDDVTFAAGWLEALLALDRGDTPTASAALDRIPSFSRSSPQWTARLETLRGEIALALGNFADALAHAGKGKSAAAAARDPAEEAHGFRLAGSARLGLSQWTEARTDFMAALRLEEKLGGGARMVGDLNHLATIAEHLGEPDEARLYAERARAIASAR